MRKWKWSCLLLAAALLPASPAAAAERETTYMAVFLDGKKIGRLIHNRVIKDSQVVTTDEVIMTMGRADVPITISLKEVCVETVDGKPVSFRSTQNMAAMATEFEGTVGPDGKLQVVTTIAGQKKSRTMDWPKGALLNEGLRLKSLKEGLKEGAAYSVSVFGPSILLPINMDVRVGPTGPVDLLGRVVTLTEVTVMTKGPTGEFDMICYVDENQDAQKTVRPMLGMKLEFVSCTRQFVLAKEDVLDFFDKLVLKSPQPLAVKSAKSIRYVLTPTPGTKLELPQTGSQSVHIEKDGSAVVTVRPIKPNRGAKFPYDGKDKLLLAAIQPTQFMQSDREIIDLARRAVGKTSDSYQAAKGIEKFVRAYIKKKDLSVGYASAAEVAASRQGDCSEHAVLAAAMCRAVGIPARVVVGIAYVPVIGDKKAVFGPHAWFQAYTGETWCDFDAALPRFDAGHIALSVGDGDMDSFFGILTMLGNFKIAEAQVEN